MGVTHSYIGRMERFDFDSLKRAPVNGTSLAYHESGDGSPVILVHGSASDIRTWVHQIDPLSVSHRVIAYSRRYARPNEDIADGVDDQMMPHVEDLNALQRVTDADPAHLIGHSWGGFVCLMAAIHHPKSVRSLILLEPPVVPLFVSIPPTPGELIALMLKRPSTAKAIISLGRSFDEAKNAFERGDDEQGMELFGRAVLGDQWFERMSQERREQSFDNVKAERAKFLGAGFPPVSEEQVRKITIPTLLVGSEHGPAAFQKILDRLEELMPNAHRVTIPNASHIMHEDNPPEFNENVLEFLAAEPAGLAKTSQS